MSIEVFPVVEGCPEAEFFETADWKKLAHCREALDAAALQLRIAPLSEFLCTTRQEALESFGEDGVSALEADAQLCDGVWRLGDQKLWSLELCWSLAGEGLGSVGALIEYSKSHPEHFVDKFQATEAACILGELRHILLQAQSESKRFCLRMTR